MFFWNSPAFIMIQWMLAIWSLVPLSFLNPACIPESSWFTYCYRPAWRILRIMSLIYKMTAFVWQFEHFFGIALLWNWNENWSFPVLWQLLSFPNLLAYWVQNFNRIIIFRILNSSAILSPPLALFLTMLLKAHLTSGSLALGGSPHYHGYLDH